MVGVLCWWFVLYALRCDGWLVVCVVIWSDVLRAGCWLCDAYCCYIYCSCRLLANVCLGCLC